MKLNDIKKAHFIGVGGAGMAGVAELFVKNGIKVSGSDIVLSPVTKRLSSQGIKIFESQKSENIVSDLSVVIVAGKAIKRNNPELKSALLKNIPVIERSDALSILTEGKKVIAVTGSHGKSTVSAMIAQSLLDNDIDASFIIGAELVKYNSGAHFGTSNIFVIEADESDASFLKYKPYISVISNIEPDHLDFYKNIENYNNTFKKYISLTKYKLIINSKDKEFVPKNPPFAIEYFQNDNNYFKTNKKVAKLVLNEFGISKISFLGIKRRFELKGVVNEIAVYDDYAHHPTEIKSLILLAKSIFPNSKINVVFEPHLFSRTKNFASEFALALKNADNVALVDIYPAREKPIKNVSSKLIKVGRYFNKWDNAINYIISVSTSGDIIFTVGAGTITKMGDMILSKL